MLPRAWALSRHGIISHLNSSGRPSRYKYFRESSPQHRARIFVGGWALHQLWLFWIAPVLGACCAGVVYRIVANEPQEDIGTSISKELS